MTFLLVVTHMLTISRIGNLLKWWGLKGYLLEMEIESLQTV